MPDIRYEYKTVEIPSDCEDDKEKRANLAILNAREMFRTYRMPANWRIVWDTGELIRVCRESRR